jgi:UDP-2,4-diacetamido-2,4,6-trideoxy-beta-L-altropyranose hydrolase
VKTVRFVVEGARRSGLGHIRRCLVLADALKRLDMICSFHLPPGPARDMAAQHGFPVSAWPDLQIPIPECDIVIGDSYELSTDDTAAWRTRCRYRVMIDDMGDRPIEADMVINHNLYGASLDYGHVTLSSLLAGPEYCLIDPAFAELAGTVRPEGNDILVSFGGTDKGHWSGRFADAFLTKNQGRRLHIAMPGNDALDTRLQYVLDRYPKQMRVHRAANMVALMSESSTFVGSAGIGILEAIAAGLPTITCAVSVNQSLAVQALKRNGGIAFDSFDAKRMADCAAMPGNKLRANIIDGHGPGRVAQILDTQSP